MHTGNELEAPSLEKGRLSCDSDAPQVGSARSDSTRAVKVNRRKTNRRKTKPYCIFLPILSYKNITDSLVLIFTNFLDYIKI